MPSRSAPAFFNVGWYTAAGQDVATAIANAILDANAQPGAVVFIPPNLGAGGNLAAAGKGTVIMDFRPGGAAIPVPGDNALAVTGATTGAGAATGTLANAPAATNPNIWLKVMVNGVGRFIPCW
jgi:hypothetical protein